MNNPTYAFASGSRLKGDANAVGQRIDEVKAAGNGKNLPAAVVDDARQSSSPLHRYFEWDDTEAARAHRLSQAQHLIRSVVIVKIDSKPVEPVRAFVTILKPEVNKSTYYTISEALSDEEVRSRLILQACREAEQWMDRYEKLAGLFGKVFPILKGVIARERKKIERKATGEKKTAPGPTPGGGGKATAGKAGSASASL